MRNVVVKVGPSLRSQFGFQQILRVARDCRQADFLDRICQSRHDLGNRKIHQRLNELRFPAGKGFYGALSLL